MFRTILSSFARGYGRSLGRIAARRTAFLAVPLLIVVLAIGYLEISGARLDSRMLGPVYPMVMQLMGK
jgi:hypothetical protein